MDEHEHMLDEESKMPKLKKEHLRVGFVIIQLVSRLLLAVIIRFWKLCSASLLVILLVLWFKGGLFASILLFLAVLGLFYNAQDMLLYYPDQPQHSRQYVELPSILCLPFESHLEKTRDGTKINLVLIKQPELGLPTVIFFHGNAGNIGHRLMNVFGLYSICKCNVLMVEYRGYGKSEGSPSENGLYKDAEAAIDFLIKRSDINKTMLFVFGRSLGGAVAVNLVSKPYYSKLVAGLILENTFTSLPDIARNIFRFRIMDFVPMIAFKNQYQSQKLLKSVHLPVLFMSGLADQLVPPCMMTTLHEVSCSHLKRIYRFPNGTHNETWMCSGYYEHLSHFLLEVYEQQKLEGENNVVVSLEQDVEDE